MEKYFFKITLLVLAATIFIPRVLDLDLFTTVDEPLWIARVSGFSRALATFNFDDTYQQRHPGVTTQWLGATSIGSGNLAYQRQPIAVGTGLLVAAIGYLGTKIWGHIPGVLLTLFIALNPMLTGLSRIIGMDALMALFLTLSLLCLMYWKRTMATRYLIYSAVACALAVMSKLPALILLPFTLIYIGLPQPSIHLKQMGIWLLVFFLCLPIILPALATNTVSVVSDIFGLFEHPGYHEDQYGPLYYMRTLVFFTTPLQMLGLLVLPIVYPRLDKKLKYDLLTILTFIVLFIFAMSIGLKKGDRYLLPAFLLLDITTALSLTAFLPKSRIILSSNLKPTAPADLSTGALAKVEASGEGWVTSNLIISISIIILITWQFISLIQIHPYYLAYVNPLTKQWFGERKLGWGEGLDLAAKYLNQKPHASSSKVAAFYASLLANKYKGEVIQAHQHDAESVDYVVLYRAMLERGDDAWETDVWKQYKSIAPEKIIYLGSLPYVWIYSKK